MRDAYAGAAMMAIIPGSLGGLRASLPLSLWRDVLRGTPGWGPISAWRLSQKPLNQHVATSCGQHAQLTAGVSPQPGPQLRLPGEV